MNRISLKKTLQAYGETWAQGSLPYRNYQQDQELAMLQRIQEFVTSHRDCFERSNLSGHITGSALVVSPEKDRFLLMHHKKLDKWLQMGGHSDGNPEAQQTAMREAKEETGLRDVEFWRYEPIFGLPLADQVLPFDIDVHHIPARKQEPEHFHYDIRYLVFADPKIPLNENEESHQMRWVTFAEAQKLTNEESMLRQFHKVMALAEKC